MRWRAIQHDEDCIGRNTALARVIFRTGETKVVHHCFDCGRSSNYHSKGELLSAGIEVAALEVVRDNRTDEPPVPCEVCGSIEHVECHHWLPQALEDLVSTPAGAWPTVNLCRRCHEEWHTAVTPELVAGNLTMFQLGARRSTTVRQLLDTVRERLRIGKRGTAA